MRAICTHHRFWPTISFPARLVYLQGGEGGASEKLLKGTGLESDVESGNITIDTLRRHHQELVIGSLQRKAMNRHDAKTALDWSQKESSAKKLLEGIKNFSKAEKFVLDLNNKYREQIREQIGKNCFSANSEEKYMAWFRELTDQKKMEYLANKKTDLHNKHRKEMVDIMAGKEGRKIFLPEAIRKQYWKQFLNSDFEQRQDLIKYLHKEHKRLKASFELLPKEVQEKYKDAFVKANLDNREKLLHKIKKETGQETLNESTEANEGRRLDKGWEVKLKTMLKNKEISRAGAASYDIWFKRLSIEDKRKMLLEKQSELDTRVVKSGPNAGKNERVVVRDEFYEMCAKDPTLLKKHEQRFLTFDLDRRLELVAALKDPSKADKKGETIAYSEAEMVAALRAAKLNPKHQELLMVTNIMDTQYRLHERARRKIGLSKTAKSEDVLAKAEKEGIKVREQDDKVKETLNRNDKRVQFKTDKNALSRVMQMKRERQRALGQVEDETKLSDELQQEKKQGAGTGEKLVETLQTSHELDAKEKTAAEQTEFRTLNLKNLELSRETRDTTRRDLINAEEKLDNSNAMIANLNFTDYEGSRERNMQEFDTETRQPQLEEARAVLLAEMRRTLPGADEATLMALLKKEDALQIDMRTTTA